MKVNKLIEVLSKLEQDRDVVIQGYEDGLCDIESIVDIKIIKDINNPEHWWVGPHANALDTFEGSTDKQAVDAYLLPRPSTEPKDLLKNK